MRSCENLALKTAKFYRASNWQGECIRALMRCDSIRGHGLQHLLYNRSHRGHRHSPEIARVVLTAGVHGIQLTALKDADSPWSKVSRHFAHSSGKARLPSTKSFPTNRGFMLVKNRMWDLARKGQPPLKPVSEHGCALDALGNALLARPWFRTAQLETEAHPALLVRLRDPARRLDGILDGGDMRFNQRSNLFRIIEVIETRSGGSDFPNRPFSIAKNLTESWQIGHGSVLGKAQCNFPFIL